MPLDKNIAKSETLPSDFYFDDEIWANTKEKVFASTWQWVGDERDFFKGPENIIPFMLHEEYLEDPLLLVKQEDGAVRCLSNVCSHRGFMLAQLPKQASKLTCGYHGRRFSLDGKFEFMPEFQGAEDFPRPCDHLVTLPLKRWRQFLFTSLAPSISFEDVFLKMEERIGFLPVEEFTYHPEYTHTYFINAHWALYCDNYLEGFHIPFVHKTLNDLLNYGEYTTEVDGNVVLQTGYSDGSGECFDLPTDHIDHGRSVTAYYYWVFPNLMFNFYPWGLQVNIVKPISKDHCKVVFKHYIYNEEIWERMDGKSIAEQTEREDEYVVEAVQKGLASRFYSTGRFSPKREKGVHAFHLLLEQYLND